MPKGIKDVPNVKHIFKHLSWLTVFSWAENVAEFRSKRVSNAKIKKAPYTYFIVFSLEYMAFSELLSHFWKETPVEKKPS